MTLTHPSRPPLDELKRLASEGRWTVLNTVASSKAGHIGGPLSAMDMLIALYFGQLRIDPDAPDHPDRDRFILSKGHNAIGLYAVLASRGYFPLSELETFDRGDSRLQGHPDMKLTPGVDCSTGSLGQGLSVGAGMALAAKRLDRDFHTWVMLGDGELHEGMVWEAVISAPRYRLDNLTAIVDLNGLQQYGWPRVEGDRFDRSEPMGHVDLAAVFAAYGWAVYQVDGHDFASLFAAFDTMTDQRGPHGRPSVILATTAKGRGISFTEGAYTWHNGVASQEQLATARAELLGSTANGVES